MESSEVFRKKYIPTSQIDITSINLSKNNTNREEERETYKVDVGIEKCSNSSKVQHDSLPLQPQLPLKSYNHVAAREENAAVGSAASNYEHQPCLKSDELPIKEEVGYSWRECVLCAGRVDDAYDVFTERTCCGHVTLCSYIDKVANLALDPRVCVSKYACRSCFHLLNVVEQAELEYQKHRGLLLGIISKNSALSYEMLEPDNVPGDVLKKEIFKLENVDSSEDDEPLAMIKPSLRREQNNTTIRDPSPEDIRQFSSDDDFYWSLDNKNDNVDDKSSLKCSFKRSKPGRPKKVKIKEEIEDNNPSDMLIVELKEEVPDGEWNSESTKKRVKRPKIKHNKNRNIIQFAGENIDHGDLICIKCNKKFIKKGHYEYHMAKHDNLHLPFICEVCGKGFKTRKTCDVHVLMHQGISEYKCIPCDKLFPTKFAFLRHDKIHKGQPKHQCEQCGKSFIHTSSFRMHKLAHSGIKKHSCDICGLALISSSHLIRHKRIHSGEKRYECDSCGKKFSEKYNMQSHMKTHLKGKDADPTEAATRPVTPNDTPGRRKRWFKCERCDQKFDRLFKLEIHLVDDHKVVLKKGRPKPRNTMKKLQRAQQAAANMVNAIASAIGAKRAANMAALSESLDVKPSVSSLNEQLRAEAAAEAPVFKTSPLHQAPPSPAADYMSPPQEPVCGSSRNFQEHHHPMIRSASTVWPHMAYNMPMSYLSRMPDYTQHN